MIAPGKYNVGPNDGRLLVHVEREGVAKKMGHDLVLLVGRWNADVTVNDDISASELRASADVNSITVLEGKGGAKALSEKDKGDIIGNLQKSLQASRFPSISFQSRQVSVIGDNATVSGDLTLVGNTQPAQLSISRTGGRVTGRLTVVQSQFGIKPFSAFMGALKVKDTIEIEVDLNLPS